VQKARWHAAVVEPSAPHVDDSRCRKRYYVPFRALNGAFKILDNYVDDVEFIAHVQIISVHTAKIVLAMATMSFTNVTYWLINATLPPTMKYPGSDTQIAGRLDNSDYKNYVYVTYYYDSSTGYNVTRISIVGFTGDPANYTNVLQPPLAVGRA